MTGVTVRADPEKMAAVRAKGYSLSEVFRFGLDVYLHIGDASWLRDFKAKGEWARDRDRTREARIEAQIQGGKLRPRARPKKLKPQDPGPSYIDVPDE